MRTIQPCEHPTRTSRLCAGWGPPQGVNDTAQMWPRAQAGTRLPSPSLCTTPLATTGQNWHRWRVIYSDMHPSESVKRPFRPDMFFLPRLFPPFLVLIHRIEFINLRFYDFKRRELFIRSRDIEVLEFGSFLGWCRAASIVNLESDSCSPSR